MTEDTQSSSADTSSEEQNEVVEQEDTQQETQDAKFEDFQNESSGVALENPDLDVIMDIPVVLSLEVGQTPISIRNLLSLNQGSVIELDRLAGEPLDVLVNGTLIAHAEVVVINDKFGLRLTDVINADDRLTKLN